MCVSVSCVLLARKAKSISSFCLAYPNYMWILSPMLAMTRLRMACCTCCSQQCCRCAMEHVVVACLLHATRPASSTFYMLLASTLYFSSGSRRRSASAARDVVGGELQLLDLQCWRAPAKAGRFLERVRSISVSQES